MNAFDLLMNNSRPVADMVTADPALTGYSIIKTTPPPESEYYLLQFDGLSAPNPGMSTSAAVIFSPDRQPIREVAHFITHATNNEAEYGGVILGLETAIKMGIKNILIEGDSQLVIYQIEGRWKGKEPRMVALSNIAKSLLASFRNVGVRYVPRTENKYADRLTNEAREKRSGFDRVL
jgi:ribonuclease HI